jgi:DNA-directed RNA polymerase specialized sigma24 family protein
MADDSHSAQFPTTQWRLVIAAGNRAAPEARAELAELCDAYWYPIYAFIRRKGHSADEACDLAQDYFTRLFDKPVIAAADRSKGRFRAFLRTDCQHFLLDQDRRARVRARVLKAVSIDADDAESRYRFEPADDMTPDRIFDRTWALTLLDRVLGLLGQEYAAKDRSDEYDRLKFVLTQGKGAVPAANWPPSLARARAPCTLRCTASENAIARSSNRRSRPRSMTRLRWKRRFVGSSRPFDRESDLRLVRFSGSVRTG